MSKRIVSVNLLPGEPVDGSGRICIHLFVPDEQGPFVEPHALHPALDEFGQPIKQQVIAKPTRGRLACDPKRTVSTRTNSSPSNVFNITQRTDDPRAVTCPKCQASIAYTSSMEFITATEDKK